MQFTYRRATLDEEFHQILAIQRHNLKSKLSDNECAQEGFLTVSHDFELLKKMNEGCAHIIAKNGEVVVGYALAMLPSFRNELPILQAVFATTDALLPKANYIVMGQICIDKPYRSMGLFKGLYQFYRKELRSVYDCLVTEVASANIRSLEAHKSVGFKVLRTQMTDGTSWELITWDWR